MSESEPLTDLPKTTEPFLEVPASPEAIVAELHQDLLILYADEMIDLSPGDRGYQIRLAVLLLMRGIDDEAQSILNELGELSDEEKETFEFSFFEEKDE